MVNNLVSVIIPVFNRPVLLHEAVESVLQQRYQDFEIIIVNDGSTDSTAEVIRNLERLHPAKIRSIHQINSGVGIARETGRQTASGEFIQYLDSDDILLPCKLEVQVAALRQHPECDIAYGKSQWCQVGHMPDSTPHKRTGERFDHLFPALLLDRWWNTHTPLYRRTLTDRIGSWLSLINEEDWEYDARAAALGARLCYCDDFVSVQRSHDPKDHLCNDGTTDPRKLRDRAKAHELILRHAWTAGIKAEQPEMQRFARELFLMSRQCGAAGLCSEAHRLFELALQASTPERASGADFRWYRRLANLIGWSRAGKVATLSDRLRTSHDA